VYFAPAPQASRPQRQCLTTSSQLYTVTVTTPQPSSQHLSISASHHLCTALQLRCIITGYHSTIASQYAHDIATSAIDTTTSHCSITYHSLSTSLASQHHTSVTSSAPPNPAPLHTAALHHCTTQRYSITRSLQHTITKSITGSRTVWHCVSALTSPQLQLAVSYITTSRIHST
jgi:hypothetical protein